MQGAYLGYTGPGHLLGDEIVVRLVVLLPQVEQDAVRYWDVDAGVATCHGFVGASFCASSVRGSEQGLTLRWSTEDMLLASAVGRGLRSHGRLWTGSRCSKGQG